jgi:hypothetical protein
MVDAASRAIISVLVRFPSFGSPLAGTKRRVLLRHTALRIHRGIADFKQSPILRIRILIGVDGWLGIGTLGKEFISAHRTPPCRRKDGFVQWQWLYAIYPAKPLSKEEP